MSEEDADRGAVAVKRTWGHSVLLRTFADHIENTLYEVDVRR